MKGIPLQVLAVIAFVTAVRAILSLQLELTQVESYLWLCSRRPALGYFDYPAMIAWICALSTGLFGHSTLGVRALPIACGAGTAAFVFLAARRIYDERVGRTAAFVAALLPLFFAYAAEATPDAPLLLFWSATLWALARALSGDSPRWWFAAGLFLGLAMNSKYHAVFLAAGVFGYLLASPEHRFWLKRREPWIAVLLAILAFSPTLIWNAQNGGRSFFYQGVSRFRESGFEAAQLIRFPRSQLLLLTPVFCLGAWAVGGRALLRWKRADWRERFLAALGMPLLLFFVAVIFVRPVRGHWPLPAYLSLIVLFAAAGVPLWVRRLSTATLVILGALYVAGPIVLATIPAPRLRGWTQLASEVAARRADFVVCNEYHLASQLAYQTRSLEVWELTPAGMPTKSFSWWWREAEHRGKNALIVYEGRRYPGELERVKRCFESVGAPVEVRVPRLTLKGGEEPETFVLIEARGYRGAARVDPMQAPSED